MRNDLTVRDGSDDTLDRWLEAYLAFEVTTAESSRKVQRRDLELFLGFVQEETGNLNRSHWTPRLSKAYKTALRSELEEDGSRRWNDRTVNRMLAHLKTFAKWVHDHQPFPLGEPMAKIKNIAEAGLLDIERALTPTERRRMLDAADLLLKVGGRSVDRHRYRDAGQRPRRKTYRAYRNRAIVYLLIETGMRRAAAANANLADVDVDRRTVEVEEKGGVRHAYHISLEGMRALQDYLEHERPVDAKHYDSPALFLPAHATPNTSGRLSPNAIGAVWNKVRDAASVDEAKTPHSARHAMGRHIMEKTGNVAAVQRQLGHKNAAYSLQYARITADELKMALDERE